MKRVLKWTVPVDDTDHPIGAGRVVLVACQDNPAVVHVWTEERETKAPPRTRRARVYGTGQPVEEGEHHIGSVVVSGADLVWHLYGGPAS